MHSILPVILCGGSGTRLWPLSRGLYPKQFMDLGGYTLFAKAVARAVLLPDSLPPLVICNQEHRFLAAAILQESARISGLERAGKASLLLEPTGRNTAPAIALAALAALEGEENDPLLLILSSDHIIEPQASFALAVSTAAQGGEDGCLVVFGIPPTRPETGFGYIQQGEELLPRLYAVSRFVEKPSMEKAEAMLAEGGYRWNSGMFLFKASVFLCELALYAPDVYAACLDIWKNRTQDLDFTRFALDRFAVCPAISVDYAVMEHTLNARMTPLDASWSDMGSWESFYESAVKNEEGNVLTGDVVAMEARDCYLHSTHRLVAALGVSGLNVVETADAVLIAARDRSQDVKILLEELKRKGRQETDTHVQVYRPWGSYEVLALGDRFQVKRIIVEPGGILSLQLHHHRAEHWVVVRGTARIVLGDEERLLKEDMSTYIPLGVRHRLENPGRIPLEIIEIQTGSYLEEDDIVRFEDTYGRID